jgi:hypothetical protein
MKARPTANTFSAPAAAKPLPLKLKSAMKKTQVKA